MGRKNMERIGILTFHRTQNYGAVLQAYALCQALSVYDVVCIDYNPPKARMAGHYPHKLYHKHKSITYNLKHILKNVILKKNIKKEKKIHNFIETFIPVTKKKYYNLKQLKDAKQQFDILISGSDQIWNPHLTGGELDTAYFLSFGNKYQKKIAYASSAGSHMFNETEKEIVKNSLSSFHAIGVREKILKNQINKILGNTARTVVDPTLLLTKKDWLKISAPLDDLEDFLLVYSFGNCKLCEKIARRLSKSLNVKIITINKKIKDAISRKDLGIQEFIGLFNKAAFIVTNSFHGTIFSIIFRKKFFSAWYSDNPYRAQNLLNGLGLESRLIKNKEQFDKAEVAVNYTIAEKKLTELRQASLDFLNDAVS